MAPKRVRNPATPPMIPPISLALVTPSHGSAGGPAVGWLAAELEESVVIGVVVVPDDALVTNGVAGTFVSATDERLDDADGNALAALSGDLCFLSMPLWKIAVLYPLQCPIPGGKMTEEWSGLLDELFPQA